MKPFLSKILLLFAACSISIICVLYDKAQRKHDNAQHKPQPHIEQSIMPKTFSLAIKMIMDFEGLKLKPYKDLHQDAICYGERYSVYAAHFGHNSIADKHECMLLVNLRVQHYTRTFFEWYKANKSPEAFMRPTSMAAAISIIDNVTGNLGTFKKSKLSKLLLQYRGYVADSKVDEQIIDEWLSFSYGSIKGQKKILCGLLNRRSIELMDFFMYSPNRENLSKIIVEKAKAMDCMGY